MDKLLLEINSDVAFKKPCGEQIIMPKQFKEQYRIYPTTRVIIDVTEIHIEQPHLPELHATDDFL